jgi:hypothetical protein
MANRLVFAADTLIRFRNGRILKSRPDARTDVRCYAPKR